MPHNFDDSYRQDSVDATRGWDGPERRVSRTPNKALVAEIICAINETHKPLTDEERQWVQLAIQREAQSIKLRQAIIDANTNAVLQTLVTLSNVNKTTNASTYVQRSYSVVAHKGKNVKIRFVGSTDSSLATTFRVDTVSLLSN